MQQLSVNTMTIVELRRLVKWCDNQHPTYWKGLNLSGLVTLYNACVDRKYNSFKQWMRHDQGAASMTLELVRAECTVKKDDGRLIPPHGSGP